MYVLYDLKLLFYGFEIFAKTFRAKRIHITHTCTHMYLVNGMVVCIISYHTRHLHTWGMLTCCVSTHVPSEWYDTLLVHTYVPGEWYDTLYNLTEHSLHLFMTSLSAR